MLEKGRILLSVLFFFVFYFVFNHFPIYLNMFIVPPLLYVATDFDVIVHYGKKKSEVHLL